MQKARRGIRLSVLLIVVAGCAIVCGLGVNLYRAWSPVRRWTRQSQPGNPQFTRIQAVMNLSYDVPASELEAAFPIVLAAAKDPDPTIRAAAVTALQKRRDHFAEVLPILLGLMKDPDPRVREAAIFHLESFVARGSPEVSILIPELVAALDDPKPAVRLEACRALYVFGQLPRAVPALARLVREEEGTHRVGGVGFLIVSKTIPKDLEPYLRAMLKNEDTNESHWARQALILLGIPDQERDAMLKPMLESPDSSERIAAVDLLFQVGKPERAIPVLEEMAARGSQANRQWAKRMLIRAKDEGMSP